MAPNTNTTTKTTTSSSSSSSSSRTSKRITLDPAFTFLPVTGRASFSPIPIQNLISKWKIAKLRKRKVDDELADSSRPEIEEIFKQLDRDQSGFIEKEDVRQALVKLKLPSSDDYISDLFGEFRLVEPDRRISRDEFVKYVARKETTMRKVFESMDKKKDKHISADECRDFLQRIGIRATLEDGQQMISVLDNSGDKLVSYPEFRKFAVLLPRAQLKHNAGWGWLEVSLDSTAVCSPRSDPWKQLIAGGFAGMLARTLVAPADRIMSIIMSGSSGNRTNPLALLGDIYKKEGIGGWFRGNALGVFKKFPQKAIEFYVYERLARFAVNQRSKRRAAGGSQSGMDVSLPERFLMGSAAGAASQTCLHVLDVAKVQQNVGRQGNFFSVMYNIMRNEGPRGMYRGYLPSLAETVLGTGLAFFTYETATSLFIRAKKKRPNPMQVAAMGAVTSGFSLTCTMPLSTLVKRMIAQGMPGVPKYKSVVDCARQIWRTEGWRGFFRGLGVSYLKVVPSIALTYLLYDQILRDWGVGGLSRYRRKH